MATKKYTRYTGDDLSKLQSGQLYTVGSNMQTDQQLAQALGLDMNKNTLAELKDAVSAYKNTNQIGNTQGNTVGLATINKLYNSGTTTPTTLTTSQATPTTQTTTNTTATNSTAGLNDGYNTMFQQYLNYLNNGVNNANSYYQQAQTEAESALNAAKEANAKTVNSNYDRAAKDYYSLYKQNQLALPEQLSKYGITGGATETAQLGLMNNYATNLANNELDRNNALTSNDADYNNQIAAMKQSYANTIAENSTNVANQLASAYLQMAQNKYNEDYEQAQAKAEEEASAKLTTEVNTWNANIQARMNEQIAKGNTVYYWKDDDGKYHWSLDPTKAATSGYTYKTLKPSNSSGSNKGDGDGNDNKVNETMYNLIVNEIQDKFGNATTASAARTIVTKAIEAYANQLNDATADAIRQKFGV